MAFPAVFPWRTSLLVIHGNIILREIGAGDGWFVLQLVGPPGRGKLGVMLALALSAPFVVAQRWNPLWGLTVTLGGAHTNLPPAPGGAPWASGAGILAGQERCVSLLPRSLRARKAWNTWSTWRRTPRTERKKEVLWLPGLLPLGAFRCSESVWPFHLMAQPGLVPPVPSGVSPSVEVVLIEAREEN